MATAIDMQHHSGQWTPLPPLAVYPAFPVRRHQSCPLQGHLDPRVSELDSVLGAQLLVEMAYVQIEVPLPVLPQHLLHDRHRYPSGKRLSASAVKQSVIAKLFIALPPAPHAPVADAHNLGCLTPGNPPGHRP